MRLTSVFFAFALSTLVTAFNVRLDLRGHGDVEYPKEVKVDVGSKFTVVLDENRTTGYSWQVVDTYLLKENLYSVL